MAAGGAFCSGPSWNQVKGEAADEAKPKLANPIRALTRKNGELLQPLQINIQNAGASATAITKLDGAEIDRRAVQSGLNSFELYLKPATATQTSTVSVDI